MKNGDIPENTTTRGYPLGLPFPRGYPLRRFLSTLILNRFSSKIMERIQSGTLKFYIWRRILKVFSVYRTIVKTHDSFRFYYKSANHAVTKFYLNYMFLMMTWFRNQWAFLIVWFSKNKNSCTYFSTLVF